jgi:hypothetical protein
MVSLKRFAGPSVVPNASPAVAYTAPVNTQSQVKQATFSNTTAGPLTITLWLDGADDAHNVVKTYAIAALGRFIAYELVNHVIPAAGTIQWQASAAGITGTISGTETV